MTELFDMIAGSETGAIIATTITLPNPDKTSEQKNAFFADKAVLFFTNHVDVLYRDPQANLILRFLIASIFMGGLGWITLRCTARIFTVDSFEERV